MIFSAFSWCSGYHICLTRRRSPVRSWAKTGAFLFFPSGIAVASHCNYINLFIGYLLRIIQAKNHLTVRNYFKIYMIIFERNYGSTFTSR